MILERLVAFPESRRILRLHLTAVPFWAVLQALLLMLPVLLRNHFEADKWHIIVATTAVPVLMGLSILWNEIYHRVTPGRYLLVTWSLAALPLALMALCHRPETLLLCLIVTAFGIAGSSPINADIYRSCYPPRARSRVLAVLNAIGLVVTMCVTYAVGAWLDADPEAFRYYLPLGAAMIIIGMTVLHRVTREPLFIERHQHINTESFRQSMWRIGHNMHAVFRDNPHFRRYEIAFFIYGTGWMICEALRPFLVTDVLGLTYEEIATSTQSTQQLTLLIMIVPVGILMDRLGPVKVAGWAFAGLAGYPLLLMLAKDAMDMTVATVAFGMAISAIHLAWTIGPLTLARTASQAPYFLAIHATLVGVRAIIGQPLAVLIYDLTGNVYIPLWFAAAAFLSGSIVMLLLNRDLRDEERRAAAPLVNPSVPS